MKNLEIKKLIEEKANKGVVVRSVYGNTDKYLWRCYLIEEKDDWFLFYDRCDNNTGCVTTDKCSFYCEEEAYEELVSIACNGNCTIDFSDITSVKISGDCTIETKEYFKVEDDTEKAEIPYVYEETEEKVISIYEDLSKQNNHVYKIYKHVDGKWVFFKAINWKPYYKIGKSGKMFRFGKFKTLEQARKHADKMQEANNYPYDVYICKLDIHGYERTYKI